VGLETLPASTFSTDSLTVGSLSVAEPDEIEDRLAGRGRAAGEVGDIAALLGEGGEDASGTVVVVGLACVTLERLTGGLLSTERRSRMTLPQLSASRKRFGSSSSVQCLP
jgi:hypothetical protein